MQKIIQLTEEEYNELLAYKELHISAINAVISEARKVENEQFIEILNLCKFLNSQIYNFRETVRCLLLNAKNKETSSVELKYLLNKLSVDMQKLNLTWKNK